MATRINAVDVICYSKIVKESMGMKVLNQCFSRILIKSITSSHFTNTIVTITLKAKVFPLIHKNTIQKVCVG